MVMVILITILMRLWKAWELTELQSAPGIAVVAASAQALLCSASLPLPPSPVLCVAQ